MGRGSGSPGTCSPEAPAPPPVHAVTWLSGLPRAAQSPGLGALGLSDGLTGARPRPLPPGAPTTGQSAAAPPESLPSLCSSISLTSHLFCSVGILKASAPVSAGSCPPARSHGPPTPQGADSPCKPPAFPEAVEALRTTGARAGPGACTPRAAAWLQLSNKPSGSS